MGDETYIFLYTEKVDVFQLKKLLNKNYKIVSSRGSAQEGLESLFNSKPDKQGLKMERSEYETTYWRY